MRKISTEEIQAKIKSGTTIRYESGRRVRQSHLNPPVPRKKPDPLEALAKQVVQIANRSDETMSVVLKTLNEMVKTLSAKEPTVVNIPEPKLKEWKLKAVRVDSKTVDITAKQIK